MQYLENIGFVINQSIKKELISTNTIKRTIYILADYIKNLKAAECYDLSWSIYQAWYSRQKLSVSNYSKK